MRLTPLLAALVLIAPLDATACSWEGISEGNVARLLPDRLRNADAVVHGKVTSLKVTGTEEVAEIRVLRSYKGGVATLTVRAQPLMCGYRFTLGEEQVFFVHKGWVGLPGVEPASDWLLKALDKVVPSTATPNKSLERTREG